MRRCEKAEHCRGDVRRACANDMSGDEDNDSNMTPSAPQRLRSCCEAQRNTMHVTPRSHFNRPHLVTEPPSNTPACRLLLLQ
mmetsp:Transcript_18284/g.52198  ORF Transcript_18284/g.52198 Transcript_18284/m.52198 type:complete len:82 (+) Transcript_18284:148-393(+)